MVDYDVLEQAVIEGNSSRVKELTEVAIEDGTDPQDILERALIPAMDVVGEKFSNHEFYIPEMLIAARAMQAGLALLAPLLSSRGSRPAGRVVIGTVKGDLHDIGKNLVSIMLQGGGFEVIDVGTDVEPRRFVDAVREQRPDFLMMSALLTTTMPSMSDTIAGLVSAGLRDTVRIAVGGAPVNQRFADAIGADFYAEDATGAVIAAKRLLWRQRE